MAQFKVREPIERTMMQQQMLYNHIQENYPDYLLGNNIRWNFTKFLVDQQGNIIARFEPDVSMVDIENANQQLFVQSIKNKAFS